MDQAGHGTGREVWSIAQDRGEGATCSLKNMLRSCIEPIDCKTLADSKVASDAQILSMLADHQLRART